MKNKEKVEEVVGKTLHSVEEDSSDVRFVYIAVGYKKKGANPTHVYIASNHFVDEDSEWNLGLMLADVLKDGALLLGTDWKKNESF